MLFLNSTQLALHVEMYEVVRPLPAVQGAGRRPGQNELVHAFSKNSLVGPSLRPHWLALQFPQLQAAPKRLTAAVLKEVAESSASGGWVVGVCGAYTQFPFNRGVAGTTGANS